MMSPWVGLAYKTYVSAGGKAEKRISTYKKTLALEQHAKIPSRATIGVRLVDDNSIEKSLAPDSLDDGVVQVLESVPEDVTELLSLGSQVLLLHDLKGTNRDSAAEWVASIGRAVSTRLNDHHDLLAAEHSTDRVHATGDGLAKGDHVRLDASPLGAKHTTSTADTSLDLVTDQENVVLLAKLLNTCEVVLLGNDDTGLALDGLNDESGCVAAMCLEDSLEILHVVVADSLATHGARSADVGNVWSVVVFGLGVSRQSDGGHLFRISEVSQ